MNSNITYQDSLVLNGRIEPTILRSLLFHEDFARQLLPFVRSEYFQDKAERILFKTIQDLFQRHDTVPTPEAVMIALNDTKGLTEDDFRTACEHLRDFAATRDQRPDPGWLKAQANKFCQDRALNNAVMEAVQIITGESKEAPATIPELLTKALAVRLEPPRAGLMFTPADADYVYDKFNSPQQRFRTGIPSVDDLTGGGLARTQVAVITAGSGVGKSMTLCAIAAEAARAGASVLYLNCESEDYELQTRIVCNLANIPSSRYRHLDREELRAVHEKLSRYTIAVRDLMESARPSDVHAAVEDFKLSIGRYPDLICVDYLNELEPERDSNGRENSYGVMGKNLKELLKLAKRTNCALWTAVQLNREGLRKSKKLSDPPDASHISESIAVLFKASLVLSLQLVPQNSPEENIGYLKIQTLKYRFNASRPECVVRLEYQYARFRELKTDEASVIISQAAVEETQGKNSAPHQRPPLPPSVFNGGIKRDPAMKSLRKIVVRPSEG